jgi:hypothetical protein
MHNTPLIPIINEIWAEIQKRLPDIFEIKKNYSYEEIIICLKDNYYDIAKIIIKITISVEGDLLLVFNLNTSSDGETQYLTFEMANPNCFHEAAESIKQYVTSECERITNASLKCIEHHKKLRSKACNVLDNFKDFGERK